MSKQKFNVGDKVKILDIGNKEAWVGGLTEIIGKTGVVVRYDKFCENYLVMIEAVGIEFWYREEDIELVPSAAISNVIDVQTCIDFLTSTGYKVTLEKI